MLRDETLHLVLYSRFALPIELRYIICENYFPFLPNEKNCLTVARVKNFDRTQPLYSNWTKSYNVVKYGNRIKYSLGYLYDKVFFKRSFKYTDDTTQEHCTTLFYLKNIRWQTEEEIVEFYDAILKKYRKTMLSFLDSESSLV